MTKFLLANTNWVTWAIFGGFVGIFAVMIMLQTRRRRTAQAEYSGMLETLRPGIRVKTVGGVIGRIKEIREEAPGFKTVLLETGSDKNTSFVLYDLQAVYGIVDDEKVMAEKLAAAQQNQTQNIQNHTSADNRIEDTQGFSKPKKTKTKSD